MSKSSSISTIAIRLGFLIGLILLAGCTAPGRPAAAVTAPPPPLVGSAPIAAYDEYALVIAPDSAPRAKFRAVAVNP